MDDKCGPKAGGHSFLILFNQKSLIKQTEKRTARIEMEFDKMDLKTV